MTQEKIRLLVIDDHTLFRRGLIALLSQDERFEIVGEAGDKQLMAMVSGGLFGVLGFIGGDAAAASPSR